MARPFRKNVGVLGLGIIGRRIADHLRHQGFSVFVWNRTPRAVPSFVGSPTELTQMCNYLQIFVGDDETLLQMIRTIGPSLTVRHIVIAHPTVSPDTMREAAAMVERRGARLVEAPFTGSKLAAEKGQLVYYVAGDEAALHEVTPLLEASSKAIVHIGEIGQASILKIATNMVTAASVQAAAEAMALVRNSGIALEKFVDALKQNASNSPTLDFKVPRMLAGDFEPHFSVKHMLKDMQIANRMARSFDLDLTVTGATRDRLLDEARHGHGDDDFCAVSRKFLPTEEPVDSAQGDLFAQSSQTGEAAVLHEDAAFVEQQLAQLSAADVEANANAPLIEQPSSPTADYDEPATESTAPVIAEPGVLASATDIVERSPVATSNQQPEGQETERRGFLRRLLRRTTDY